MNVKILSHTAKLACLHLNQKEKEEFSSQLSLVFEYFNKMISYPVPDNLEPLVDPLDGLRPTPAPYRTDETLIDTLDLTKPLLALAPELLGQEYVAPEIGNE